MFNTELNIEEEVLLNQILEGEKLTRVELLHSINSICENSNNEEGIVIAKSLFEKVKRTSDFEYKKYIEILLTQPKEFN